MEVTLFLPVTIMYHTLLGIPRTLWYGSRSSFLLGQNGCLVLLWEYHLSCLLFSTATHEMVSGIYFFSSSCIYCHSSLPLVGSLEHWGWLHGLSNHRPLFSGLEAGPITHQLAFQNLQGILTKASDFMESWPTNFDPVFIVCLLATGSRALCMCL